MIVELEKRNEIDVVRPAGRIDNATAGVFERAVAEVLDAGSRRLVLDFSRIEYISSAGLRSTLIIGKRMRGVPGGKLVLCSIAPAVHEIFEISGFVSILSICADLDTALAACAAA